MMITVTAQLIDATSIKTIVLALTLPHKKVDEKKYLGYNFREASTK